MAFLCARRVLNRQTRRCSVRAGDWLTANDRLSSAIWKTKGMTPEEYVAYAAEHPEPEPEPDS
jgi:hypothetical protein